MLLLRDIMTTCIVTMTPETSIREAMELLGKSHVSGAPVLGGGKLVGVVTATDLLTFASTLSGVPTERDIADDWFMTADELSIGVETEDEAEPSSAYFSELWDDSGADVACRIENVGGPEWNALEEHDVSEAMTRVPLVTLPADADIEAAARVMTHFAIHRVLIMDGEALVGVVSAMDITRAVADHSLVRRTFVFNHDETFRGAE
jgi:CBS domain-containing protein